MQVLPYRMVKSDLVINWGSIGEDGEEPKEPWEIARDAFPKPKLTKREAEVLALLARGFSDKMIAMNIDPTGSIDGGTVKVHVRSILNKLRMYDPRVENRTHAALLAASRGVPSFPYV